jgi:4'-phosphopantetheinyl transferase EntD
MPLLVKRHVQEGVELGIWEIAESVDELLSQLTLTPGEETIFSQLRGDLRKQHWLSYRLIIKKIINSPGLLDINYSPFGRPIILNHISRISVSHSGLYAAAMVSNKKPVGIDIEKIHPRIEKVIHKFLNHNELEDLHRDYTIEHMHLCWSAKEAMYKFYHRRQLDFRLNMIIDPFIFQPQGEITARIQLPDLNRRLLLQYEMFNGYILVFVKDLIAG